MESDILKIATSSYYLPSESKIGAGAQAHGLANALVRRGHAVTMFSPCRKPAGALYEHVHHPLSGRFRTFRWPMVVRSLDLAHFDVYHAAGDDYLLFGRSRPAHVRTLYGSCFAEALHIKGAKGRLRMLLLGIGEVIATVAADRSACISQGTRRWFPWVGAVIPCGVDLDRFAPGVERSPVPTILFVGTYGQRKRGWLLMDAFGGRVRTAIPDAELWMVCSDAPEAEGVKVLGWLSDDELADRYRAAWIFCLPSSYEGFGVPYIEALATGAAVVATPNSGAVEILSRAGIGRLTSPERLGSVLVELLGDSATREHWASAGPAIAREYSWDTIAEQYETIYRELLVGKNPSRRTFTRKRHGG